MRKILLPLVIIVVAVGVIYFVLHKKQEKSSPKQRPLAVSQHTDSFNQSINAMLASYDTLTEAFVNWDSAAVAKNAVTLSQKLNAIDLSELKKDSVIYQTAISYKDNFATDLKTIEDAPGIAKKRTAFNSFSQNLYDLLRTVHYDRSKIYLQECPMAFNNEATPGMWLSRNEAIRNPYMGLHHPKYGKAMIECGDTKDSVNFTGATAL